MLATSREEEPDETARSGPERKLERGESRSAIGVCRHLAHEMSRNQVPQFSPERKEERARSRTKGLNTRVSYHSSHSVEKRMMGANLSEVRR